MIRLRYQCFLYESIRLLLNESVSAAKCLLNEAIKIIQMSPKSNQICSVTLTR